MIRAVPQGKSVHGGDLFHVMDGSILIGTVNHSKGLGFYFSHPYGVSASQFGRFDTKQEAVDDVARRHIGGAAPSRLRRNPARHNTGDGTVRVEYGPYSGRYWRLTGVATSDIPKIEVKSAQKGGPWQWYETSGARIGPAEWGKVVREWDKARKPKRAPKTPKANPSTPDGWTLDYAMGSSAQNLAPQPVYSRTGHHGFGEYRISRTGTAQEPWRLFYLSRGSALDLGTHKTVEHAARAAKAHSSRVSSLEIRGNPRRRSRRA